VVAVKSGMVFLIFLSFSPRTVVLGFGSVYSLVISDRIVSQNDGKARPVGGAKPVLRQMDDPVSLRYVRDVGALDIARVRSVDEPGEDCMSSETGGSRR
jgi:hypothetical protein